MGDRVPVTKTWKLFIGGSYPRTESGRSTAYLDGSGGLVGHLCKASRKDFRDAVEAARAAQLGWADSTAYLRCQILYRLAEMVEGRKADFVDALRLKGKRGRGAAEREIEAAIDRTVSFAGWCDKLHSVLGHQNQVAGPYYNFTTPESVGVVAVIDNSDYPLLGLLQLILPALASGGTVVALVSEIEPIPALLLAEVCPSSDIPNGVVNILTGATEELVDPIITHRGVDAIVASVERDLGTRLEIGRSENLKRVKVLDPSINLLDHETCTGPSSFSQYVEYKTVWQPYSA